MPKENLTRSRAQLAAIQALTPLQRQFIATMVDTEVAIGYFLRKSYVSGGTWVAYAGVKMKYGGDLKYFSTLISHIPPSRHWYSNTIKKSRDLRWSLQVQGIVAFALLRAVKKYMHNEKSLVEADCVLRHGPVVEARLPHPFLNCGACRLRRGVWRWPHDEEDGVDMSSTVDK